MKMVIQNKKRSKRSQAQIITVILIILIVIVAMLIVWNFVRPLIARAAERISLSRLKVDLDIESAYIDDDNQTAYVAVKRGVGKANLTALKFIFTDVNGKNYIYKYPIFGQIPDELESKVYNITAFAVHNQNLDFNNFSSIVSVGIAFVVRTSYGSEVTSGVKDTFGDSKKEDLRRDVGLANLDPGDYALVFEDPILDGDCTDGNQNQDETDVDCGGVICSGCQNGESCLVDLDCASGNCVGGVCEIVPFTYPPYVSWWKFDGDAIDSGPGGNDGTLVDGVFVYDSERNYTGSNGYVLSLDGDGDYVDVGNPSSLNFTNTTSFSISVWVYKLDATRDGIVSKGNYALYYVTDRWQFEIKDPTSYGVSSGDASPANKWVYLGVVYDSSNNNLSLYKNGNFIDSADFSGVQDFSTSDTFKIGYYFFADQEWNGTIDDVMIFNRSLSADEILQIYNAQKHLCTGLTECSEYTDSNSCTNNPCNITLGCEWNGTNCYTAGNTWYVRPYGGDYGTEDGTSYENAWDGLENVLWGQDGVNAGDTLYVSGLHIYPETPQYFDTTKVDITASGNDEDSRIIIRGDYPEDAGTIWGNYIIGGSLSEWAYVGNNTHSIESENTRGYFYFENITGTWDLLTKVNSIQEVMDTPGSYYSPTFTNPDPVYFHLSDNGDPNLRVSTPPVGYNIYLTGQEYITFLNIDFYSPMFHDIGSYIRWEGCKLWYGGLSFADNAHHIEVIDCDRAYGNVGFYFRDNTPYGNAPNNVTIRGCYIHDIGIYDQNVDAECIGVNGLDDAIIENNEFYNCGSAITLYPYGGNPGQTSKNIIIRRNYIHDMHTLGGARGRGIELNMAGTNTEDKSGCEVYGNIVANIPGVAYRSTWPTYQINFYNNIAYNSSTSFYFDHVYYPDRGPNITIRNCISVNPTIQHIAFGSQTTEGNYTIDSDYNLFYPDGTGLFYFKELSWTENDNFSEWQSISRVGCIFDPNSMIADPGFVSPDPQVPADFKLQFDSPAIDNGTDVGLILDYEGNVIPQGAGPDIGAYEYVP